MPSGRQHWTHRPTLDHVAECARVSRATVSRVINDVPTVNAAIREKVERAIATTGYVPNLAARALVTRRTDSVALVISEPDHCAAESDAEFLNRIFTDPYFGRVIAGAQEYFRPRGVHLVVIPAGSAGRQQVVQYLRQGHVDGVLLVSGHLDNCVPEWLSTLHVPVVGFGDSSDAATCQPSLTTVRQPIEEMAAAMARLLLAHITQPDRRPRSVPVRPTPVVRQSA